MPKSLIEFTTPKEPLKTLDYFSIPHQSSVFKIKSQRVRTSASVRWQTYKEGLFSPSAPRSTSLESLVRFHPWKVVWAPKQETLPEPWQWNVGPRDKTRAMQLPQGVPFPLPSPRKVNCCSPKAALRSCYCCQPCSHSHLTLAFWTHVGQN